MTKLKLNQTSLLKRILAEKLRGKRMNSIPYRIKNEGLYISEI
ncbi:hypothetical protein GYH30_012632 [Glycine max]|nr:hypothetical protein GYH30_012632 [Glycine max]